MSQQQLGSNTTSTTNGSPVKRRRTDTEEPESRPPQRSRASNETSKKRMLKCESCRRSRQKCVVELGDKCRRCTERNLTCSLVEARGQNSAETLDVNEKGGCLTTADDTSSSCVVGEEVLTPLDMSTEHRYEMIEVDHRAKHPTCPSGARDSPESIMSNSITTFDSGMHPTTDETQGSDYDDREGETSSAAMTSRTDVNLTDSKDKVIRLDVTSNIAMGGTSACPRSEKCTWSESATQCQIVRDALPWLRQNSVKQIIDSATCYANTDELRLMLEKIDVKACMETGSRRLAQVSVSHIQTPSASPSGCCDSELNSDKDTTLDTIPHWTVVVVVVLWMSACQLCGEARNTPHEDSSWLLAAALAQSASLLTRKLQLVTSDHGVLLELLDTHYQLKLGYVDESSSRLKMLLDVLKKRADDRIPAVQSIFSMIAHHPGLDILDVIAYMRSKGWDMFDSWRSSIPGVACCLSACRLLWESHDLEGSSSIWDLASNICLKIIRHLPASVAVWQSQYRQTDRDPVRRLIEWTYVRSIMPLVDQLPYHSSESPEFRAVTQAQMLAFSTCYSKAVAILKHTEFSHQIWKDTWSYFYNQAVYDSFGLRLYAKRDEVLEAICRDHVRRDEKSNSYDQYSTRCDARNALEDVWPAGEPLAVSTPYMTVVQSIDCGSIAGHPSFTAGNDSGQWSVSTMGRDSCVYSSRTQRPNHAATASNVAFLYDSVR